MNRSVRAWVVGLALVAGWVIAGLFFASDSLTTPWLAKWAVFAAVVAPLAWIGIYTVQGLSGHGKWWASDLGVNMVWLEAAVAVNIGTLAWAVLFHKGAIDTPISAWTYIGGLYAGAIIITWRSVIWLRNYRREPPLVALTKRNRELEAERDALQARLDEIITGSLTA